MRLKGCDMKKLEMFGLVCGATCAAIFLMRKRQSSQPPEEREERQHRKRRAMFQKMKDGMDAMPEDFPPVVMFENVAATRENSERILELLEKSRSEAKKPVDSATK